MKALILVGACPKTQGIRALDQFHSLLAPNLIPGNTRFSGADQPVVA